MTLREETRKGTISGILGDQIEARDRLTTEVECSREDPERESDSDHDVG